MKFYEALSQVYDIVFPKNENTFHFLSKGLKPKPSILDIACGTGNYAIGFGKQGHDVDAIDLDYNMLEQARKKAMDVPIHFVEGDMTKIKECFPGKRYDMIYCIGNSIVHLPNKQTIEELIKDTYDMLHEGGMLIIQIVNYDRIIKYKVDHLPTIENEKEGVRFIRKYAYHESEKRVDFNTELIIHNHHTHRQYKNSTSLLALQSHELKEIIEKARFSTVDFYGSFLKDQYDDQSYAMIVKAFK